MKNTLLALMLVSLLFVISCGADSTKPQDAFKSQKTEVSSGTKTVPITSASSKTVGVSTFAKPGEKVIEIIEVSDNSSKDTKPTVKKNQDNGIYEFTTTTTSNPTSVTYKYTKTLIAPIVTKTISVSPSGSTVDMSTYPLFAFEPNVISVKDTQGNNISFSYEGGNTITLRTTPNGYVTVEYQCMDVNIISEEPTKEGKTSSTSTTIQLTATADAGKTYVCKVYQNPMTAEYFYGIVPANGQITLSSTQQDHNYKLWVY